MLPELPVQLRVVRGRAACKLHVTVAIQSNTPASCAVLPMLSVLPAYIVIRWKRNLSALHPLQRDGWPAAEQRQTGRCAITKRSPHWDGSPFPVLLVPFVSQVSVRLSPARKSLHVFRATRNIVGFTLHCATSHSGKESGPAQQRLHEASFPPLALPPKSSPRLPAQSRLVATFLHLLGWRCALSAFSSSSCGSFPLASHLPSTQPWSPAISQKLPRPSSHRLSLTFANLSLLSSQAGAPLANINRGRCNSTPTDSAAVVHLSYHDRLRRLTAHSLLAAPSLCAHIAFSAIDACRPAVLNQFPPPLFAGVLFPAV